MDRSVNTHIRMERARERDGAKLQVTIEACEKQPEYLNVPGMIQAMT